MFVQKRPTPRVLVLVTRVNYYYYYDREGL